MLYEMVKWLASYLFATLIVGALAFAYLSFINSPDLFVGIIVVSAIAVYLRETFADDFCDELFKD